ncbi:RDD family protein [Breznakiella homolactica]|uniref:RDD family protein n=1 Tax=Breznakiella homolactica TaxID=2798577 RepID=A0A7T7XQ28_9SPIR|nr:RDD family protein [Breznakiella homolactica]QQO10374.1 RDD family protein [Breznakiella homolactica]
MNNKRLFAGIIDFVVTCFIQAFLMMIFLILPLTQDKIRSDQIMSRQLLITYCFIIYLLIRDVLGKRSIGKRILKLKIVVKGSEEEASFKQRLLRNITWLLGPVEIIYFLIKKERLGEKIFKTDVVELNK